VAKAAIVRMARRREETIQLVDEQHKRAPPAAFYLPEKPVDFGPTRLLNFPHNAGISI